jgi:uncharacterized repeat protein (TIGR01451 family)
MKKLLLVVLFSCATLTTATAQPPTVVKTFNPTTIVVGGTSTLSITITNPATAGITAVAFTDTLPAGMTTASPSNLTGNCGGVSFAGGNTLSLTGGTLAAGANCVVSATVRGTAVGVWTNSTGPISALAANGAVVTGTPATALLAVLAPPTLTKAFGAATIQTGASTTLAFTLTNPAGNPVTFAGLAFSDTLPSGLIVSTPNGLVGSCPPGTITATAGSGSVSLGGAGATLAAGASCTFSIIVTATGEGIQNNTTSTVTDIQGITGLGATASITVVLPPTISKTFNDAELQVLGPSSSTALRFTITNPNAATSLTGLAFTDTLPAGLVVSTPNGLIGSCGGGTITAVAGSNSISLTGATLAGGVFCTFSVDVTGTAVGVFTNTTGPVTAFGGTVVGNTATATVSVDFLFFYWFFAA